MNKTHLEHTVIALAIQLCLWPLVGLWAGGIAAVALLLGREIAQHEYKEALSKGWVYGQPMNISWYAGVTKHWSLDSVLDVVIPALVCAALAAVL